VTKKNKLAGFNLTMKMLTANANVFLTPEEKNDTTLAVVYTHKHEKSRL